MMDAAAEAADVLIEPGDMTSCAVVRCPSPPSYNQRAEEECHNIAKLEKERHCNKVKPKKKVKPRGKLSRSSAVWEETPPSEETVRNTNTSGCHDDATSCKEEEQEPKEDSPTKESSEEYTDSTGIDLQQFIVDSLNSNPRDRLMLLKLEQDMMDFIGSNSPFKKFAPMSPYHRMLVHRVAAYFGMEHNVDHTGKSVIINTTSRTRIPEQHFLDMVHKGKSEEIQQWKTILKRDNSFDEQSRSHLLRPSRSMEEREEEYQKARERIFNKEPLGPQESTRAETRDTEEYNPYAETQRRRQLFRGSRNSSGSSWTGSSSMQSSMETDGHYSNDPRPWSSTDSDSSYQWTNPAPKPHQPASHNWDTRGSISLYRLPSTCPQPSSPIVEEPAPNPVYIAETEIPPGSILVNPRTGTRRPLTSFPQRPAHSSRSAFSFSGHPFLNPDGTPAVYIPADNQQPIKSQTQLQACPPPPLQQQVLQCSSVSYTAPQMVHVVPSQPYSTIEDLSSQFAHVTVGCPSTAEPPPLYHPNHGFTYAPPTLPNPSSYCQPPPQVPGYYYSQNPLTAQYGCSSPGQHGMTQAAPAAPSAGSFPPALKMQQSPGNQPQAVLGTYAPVAPHQCSIAQGGVPVPFPQSKVVTGGAADVAYCCVVAPPPHHSGSCFPPGCTSLGGAPVWTSQY
ncbi:cAMP-regulated phosphoprotein 21 [Oryzias melastigma]|uniref:cAMP-regulated phosphoprotein 21 n=1 Tax=Oryzias melastigma TaxID=30732 RepID=A0A834KZG4_ORYME|nr:cAMP-regulated phosphoprotein 21 [Oryzias melastigma]